MAAFGPESTTDDVLEGIDLTGRRILVTGASAGLGLETTRALAAHGASVTMAVRDLTKGAAAMEEVLAAVPDADLDLRRLDLADLASVRAFADGFLEDHPTPRRAHRQRRDHGLPVRHHGRRVRAAVRHQPPRPLPPDHPPAAGPRSRRTARGWCCSARRATASATSTSTIPASSTSRTTRGWPTAAPRRPTCCARWGSTSGTGTRACAPSPSTRAGSRPSSGATSPTRRCRSSSTVWPPLPPRRCGRRCRRAPPPASTPPPLPISTATAASTSRTATSPSSPTTPTRARACAPTPSTRSAPTRSGPCPSDSSG